MFMKTFEENLNAWLEGRLNEKELADFEASLPQISAAELEEQEALKLGAFLKESCRRTPAWRMRNFLIISCASRSKATRTSAKPARPDAQPARNLVVDRSPGLDRCGFARHFCRLHFLCHAPRPRMAANPLTSRRSSMRASIPAVSPDATISMFESKEDKVTVLWVDGLQSLPSEYAAK